MIEFGRSLQWKNNYMDEVAFSIANGFDFMQIWHFKGELEIDNVIEPKEYFLRDVGYPLIIHALLDISKFDERTPEILRIVKFLGHKELIIHPICHSEPITDDTIRKLADKVASALEIFNAEGITLFLENNSKLDPIHYKTEEIAYMFSMNPTLELLLDVAHTDNYEHLRDIVSIKMPKILHIADRHFDVIHEHLPIGDGEVDFKHIFTEFLPGFDGKVILEIFGQDQTIIHSKELIQAAMK